MACCFRGDTPGYTALEAEEDDDVLDIAPDFGGDVDAGSARLEGFDGLLIG